MLGGMVEAESNSLVGADTPTSHRVTTTNKSFVCSDFTSVLRVWSGGVGRCWVSETVSVGLH